MRMLRSPVGVTAGAAGVLLMLAWAGSTQAETGGAPVVVTITNAGVQLLPSQVGAGSVTFAITNRSSLARTLTVAGKKTALITPGKSARLVAAIPNSGTYLLLSYGAHHAAGLSSVLIVVDACTHPAATSVAVTMREGPIELSRTSVPCGTVTFTVTNTGTIVHGFVITGPNDASHFAPGGQGPRLAPGQTAQIVVTFATKGRAFYRCSEPEHDETYGESGFLSVA
jgi:uncharacterized cupredoxin-like copper-binding protein